MMGSPCPGSVYFFNGTMQLFKITFEIEGTTKFWFVSVQYNPIQYNVIHFVNNGPSNKRVIEGKVLVLKYHAIKPNPLFN